MRYTVYINEIFIVIRENFCLLKIEREVQRKVYILKYLKSSIKRKFEKCLPGFFKQKII